MLKVRILTVKDYTERTLKHLQAAGVLHVEEAQELSPLDREAIERDKNDVRKALGYLNNILDHLLTEQIVRLRDVAAPSSLADVIREAQAYHDRVSSLTEKYDLLVEEIATIEDSAKYLGTLAQEIDIPLKDLRYSGPYLFTDVLAIAEESYRTFTDKAQPYILEHVTVAVDTMTVIYFVARSEHRKTLNGLLREFGTNALFIPDDDMSIRDFVAQSSDIITRSRHQLAALQQEIQDTIVQDLDRIVFFREILEDENERLSVLVQACEAHYVTLIEGFVPESRADDITEGLKEMLRYAFVGTETPAVMDEPPTKLQNPGMIRPFEVIVNLFSLPKYGDWDPTPSVAYFFAFFFGLMLNDTIYAVGLLILAKFLLDKLVDDPASEGTRLFRHVLYISGSVALILGIISGTYLGDFINMYFGVDLKALALVKGVQARLADPISFIILSLLIGLIHLNIAHVLGMIKGFHDRHYGVIIGKIGLFMVQIFGIPYIFKAMLGIALIPMGDHVYAAFLYPLAAGLLLVVVGAFVQMGGLGAVFWIFDLTGILGDVMSYSRLAGVGLATFYLASSFNLLSDWVSTTIASVIPGGLGTAVAFIVGVTMLVIFHVFNLLLSSLAAFIHSLRLCFVEFLLKFYEGGGKEYNPFHQKLRREVIVGKKS